jgi:battenin
MPFIIPLTYFFILPPNSNPIVRGQEGSEPGSEVAYAPLATTEDQAVLGSDPPLGATLDGNGSRTASAIALTPEEKWRLVKPLLFRYMLPLCELLFISVNKLRLISSSGTKSVFI